MTWAEWVNSEYNTGEYHNIDSFIYYQYYLPVIQNSTDVSAYDTINENAEYYTATDHVGGEN